MQLDDFSRPKLFRIAAADDPQRVLEPADEGLRADAPVALADLDRDRESQLWMLDRSGFVTNFASGFVLDLFEARRASGTPIIVGRRNPNPPAGLDLRNQQWRLDRHSRLVSLLDDGLTVRADAAAGAPAVIGPPGAGGDGWVFRPEQRWRFPSLEDRRTRILLEVRPYTLLIDRLVAEADVMHAWIDTRSNGPGRGARRVVLDLAVPAALYDRFFNAVGGYRAQYDAHPLIGEQVNGFILDALRPKLDAAIDRALAGADRALARRTLGHPQRKIWIRESPDEGVDFADLMLHLDIVNDWKMAAVKARMMLDQGAGLTAANTKPIWGVRAPTGAHLQIKGGWELAGQSYIDDDKRQRSLEIGYYGFS